VTPIILFGAAVRADGQPSTALRRRIEVAAAYGATLPDPLYVPTGGIGRHGPAESAVMAEGLIARGVSPDRILQEPTGRNTLRSVLACTALLRARGHKGPVVAASSAYHLPRCMMLLRLAGWKVRACPPHKGSASDRFGRRWYWRLREFAALPVDAVVLIWLQRAGGRKAVYAGTVSNSSTAATRSGSGNGLPK